MSGFEQKLLLILSFLLLVTAYISGNIIISLAAFFVSLILWKKNKKNDTFRGGRDGDRTDS